jgi:hypothetical protein
MNQPNFRGDKEQKKLEKELDGQGGELAARLRQAKAYEEKLQHHTLWSNEAIARGLKPDPRIMTCHIQEHPMVVRFRTDPRLGKPPYGYGTPHFASHGPPRLDPFKPPVHNPNEFYYVSPGGGLKLTLGQLTGIGRMISDDEWLRILCGWSPMQYAHSMGLSGGSPNSVEHLIEWLNKNTRLGLPDYTAACLDMYYAGLGIREGFLVLGGAPAVRPKIKKPYPLEYRAEGRSYSRDTVGRYQLPKIKRSLDDLDSLRGAKISEIEALIPNDWIASPLKKGEGMRYINPNRRGESILIENGWPNATTPLHRGPYLKVSRNGKISRIPLEGNPVLK